MSQRTALEQDQPRAHKPSNAIDEDRIFDAALSLVLAVGPGRVTMADIARRAGVSRPTLYRRWPNVKALIASVMTREWQRISIDAIDESLPSGRERVVHAVVAVARATREHPLLRTVIELDPEFLLTYLLERQGTSTTNHLDLIELGILDGVADGSIRAKSPGSAAAGQANDETLRAQSIFLTSLSFVLTGPVLTDDLDALDNELTQLIDRYLAP